MKGSDLVPSRRLFLTITAFGFRLFNAHSEVIPCLSVNVNKSDSFYSYCYHDFSQAPPRQRRRRSTPVPKPNTPIRSKYLEVCGSIVELKSLDVSRCLLPHFPPKAGRGPIYDVLEFGLQLFFSLGSASSKNRKLQTKVQFSRPH